MTDAELLAGVWVIPGEELPRQRHKEVSRG
jgi:hypothetical protein